MSIKIVDTAEVMYKTLQQHLANNVWNTPLTECRRNIVLSSLVNGKSCVSSANLEYCYVTLPYASSTQKKAFYLYAANKCCMGGLVVDTELDSIKNNKALKDKWVDGWLPLKDYLNVRPFDLRIHGTMGEWLYRDFIYIRNHPVTNQFLLAIETTMLKSILGSDYNHRIIYMSVYYDSDNDLSHLPQTSPQRYCFYPKTDAEVRSAFNAYDSLTESQKDQTMLFINGRESTISSIGDLKKGQYIEMIYDPDIKCNIVLDFTKPEQNKIYRSTIDNTFKHIVHIPKSSNLENYIITHNTCDLFIRPKTASEQFPINEAGLFVHRFNTSIKDETTKLLKDYRITQITHNDFGVSDKLLQPYMQKIHSSECYLRIVVRKHSKQRILKYDNNFLAMLYQFNDSTILNFLTGTEEQGFDFWRAQNLEAGEFAKMLFEVPSEISEVTAQKYIDALGYYNSAAILTPKMKYTIKDPAQTRKFNLYIPASMLACDDITCLMYINSKPYTRGYTCTKKQDGAYQFLEITISDTIELHDNDSIDFELIEKPTSKAQQFHPSMEQNTITIDTTADIYQIYHNSHPVEDYYGKNYTRGGYSAYRKLSDEEIKDTVVITKNEDNTYTLSFREESWNRYYLICSTKMYFKRSVTKINLDDVQYEVQGQKKHMRSLIHTGILFTSSESWSWNYSRTDVRVGEPVPQNKYFEKTTDPITAKIIYVPTKDTVFQPDKDYYTREHYLVRHPLVNYQWSNIVFLNQLQLVQGVDYVYKTIFSKNGHVIGTDIFLNNIAYLKEQNNRLDCYVSSDRRFITTTGFTHKKSTAQSNINIIDEIDPFIYWFDELTSLSADGRHYKAYKQNGKLLINNNGIRAGAIYGVRGSVPIIACNFLDYFTSNEIDVEKLTKIANYIRKINAPIERQIQVIPHSHYIASTTMNEITKDTLTGKIKLVYNIDKSRVLDQVKDYMDFKPYDAALSTLTNNLLITNAGTSKVNATYKLFDNTQTGAYRRWYNDTNHLCVWWNPNYKRWQVRDTLVSLWYGNETSSPLTGANDSIFYYSETDQTGEHNICNMIWYVGEKGTASVPTFKLGCINLQYIDIFPTYLQNEHIVYDDICLRQVAQQLLPADPTKDGGTTT